jgi:nucleotide-binding universal stress UspA family protein
MTTPKRFKIVAAYDFSEQAEMALDRAVAAAEGHPRADLHVIGVLDERGHAKYTEAADMQAAVTSIVDARIEKSMSNHLRVFVHARIGDPTEQILNVAAEANADVVVVGTHGRTGVRRWLLGSVAERVVRYAGCPVLVVRPKTYYEETGLTPWQPEPPCDQCVEAREQTDGEQWWCERHARPHERPHRYSYNATTMYDTSDHKNSILW